jgi:hypothetical protein
MQEKSRNIKITNQFCSSVKAVLNYCLVLLFALAFSVQQFSAFAYTQLAESAKNESKTQLPSQHLLNNIQFAYHLPIAPNPLEWEMEFVEEDDEYNSRKISADDCGNLFKKTYSSDEAEYATSLNSRYLQLISFAGKRPSIPFFILYHSWKSFLS